MIPWGGELVECGVGGREAEAPLFLLCLPVDKTRAGMKIPLLDQHLDDSQSLRGHFQSLLFELFYY